MIDRTVSGVRALVQVGSEFGLSVSDCLRATRLTSDDLADAGTVIDASVELEVARNILSRVNDPLQLGIRVGSLVTLGQFGIFGFALLASPTLGEAVTLAVDYAHLSGCFSRLRLVYEKHLAALVFDASEIPSEVREFVLARDLRACAVVLPTAFGAIGELHLELPFNRESIGAAARAFAFSTATTFDSQRCAVVFPRERLSMALPQADAHTARICAEQCQELLARRRTRVGVSSEVRYLLTKDPGYFPAMSEVAKELSLDSRTLRRRLTAEGTSFTAIRDEVRSSLAAELLTRYRLNVNQTARRLGYTESASFSRAFTKWHGTPPSQYLAR